MNDSIYEALCQHFRDLASPRGDEAFAHISDLAAPCDRATWHRRHGDVPLPLDAATAAKFAMGKDVERHVVATLKKRFGDSRIIEDAVIVWDPTDDTWDFMPEAARSIGATELIGHIDALRVTPTRQPEHVYEAKSTSFLRGKVPIEPAAWNREQATAYATPLRVNATIPVVCRESGRFVEFPVEVDDKAREWARNRALEVLALTNPVDDPPPADPRYSWACKNCRYAQCTRNPNHRATLEVVK